MSSANSSDASFEAHENTYFTYTSVWGVNFCVRSASIGIHFTGIRRDVSVLYISCGDENEFYLNLGTAFNFETNSCIWMCYLKKCCETFRKHVYWIFTMVHPQKMSQIVFFYHKLLYIWYWNLNLWTVEDFNTKNGKKEKYNPRNNSI